MCGEHHFKVFISFSISLCDDQNLTVWNCFRSHALVLFAQLTQRNQAIVIFLRLGTVRGKLPTKSVGYITSLPEQSACLACHVNTRHARTCWGLNWACWLQTFEKVPISPIYYIHDIRHDSITFKKFIKILCFPQKLSRGLQWVRQSTLHCTTEAMTIHNDQSSIKRIYMTLKCMCVFLLFPLCFFSWRPIKYDSVTPYVIFMMTDKNNSVTPCVLFHDDQSKTTALPLMFFFHDDQSKTTALPLMVFFMTTKEHLFNTVVFYQSSWKNHQGNNRKTHPF
jgi:hypothetical protein